MRRPTALFKPGNAGVFPIKHDVTDRGGWEKVLEQIKDKYGRLHLVGDRAQVDLRRVERNAERSPHGVVRERVRERHAERCELSTPPKVTIFEQQPLISVLQQAELNRQAG